MKESEVCAMAIKDIIALEKISDSMPALEFLFEQMRLAKYREAVKEKEANNEKYICY